MTLSAKKANLTKQIKKAEENYAYLLTFKTPHPSGIGVWYFGECLRPSEIRNERKYIDSLIAERAAL